MKKILVHLHLYYHNQVDFMIKMLKSITGCEWDLYVTVTEENENSANKILKFKPDAQIIKVKNIGYDILPFINVLRLANASKYDFVLKIHTKNFYTVGRNFNNYPTIGYGWRNTLISTLLGSKEVFEKNMQLLSEKENGIIINKEFMLQFGEYLSYPTPCETYLLDDLKSRLGIKSNYDYFIAGTMFMAKAEIFKPLIHSDICDADFDENSCTGTDGSIAHSLERIFCILADEAGLVVVSLKNRLDCLSIKDKFSILNFAGFYQNIFSIKNVGIRKTVTICGIRIRHKSKKLEQRKFENEKKGFLSLPDIRTLKNCILYFDHSLGGGSETYFFNQLSELKNDNLVVRIQYFLHNKTYKMTLYGHDKTKEISELGFSNLTKLLDGMKIDKIVLSNIVAYPNVKDILDLIESYKINQPQTEIVMKGHDYYSICPRYTLLNYKDEYCGIDCPQKECNRCFNKFQIEYDVIMDDFSISNWRKMWGDFYKNAVDIVEVFCPSSKKIFEKAYPFISEKIVVKPHKVKPFPKYNIAILGDFRLHKGSGVVINLVKYLERNKIYDYHFYLVGSISYIPEASDLITTVGKYKRNELPNILKSNNIDLVLISSIWPETFSYTTAEAILANYPVACFDMGGQADQVRNYDKGLILSSFEPEVMEKELGQFIKQKERIGELV